MTPTTCQVYATTTVTNVAAIDIGSNSVRLLVTNADGAELEREMHITRLAEGVDRGGHLIPVAMARTLEVLGKYATLLRKHDVAATRVTATSAARDAKNREDFFQAVKQRLGTVPELLSGREEAALAFFGATGGEASSHQRVTLDIGGGSTEIAVGQREVTACHSVNMGCVRITERFFEQDPPKPAQLSAARAFIRTLLAELEAHVARPANSEWIGLAGTITSLAAWDAGLEQYTPAVTHDYPLQADRVSSMVERLSAAPEVERRKWLLEPQRAAVILGGALVLEETMQHFDVDCIRVSEHDILDGLAASLRAQTPAPPPRS